MATFTNSDELQGATFIDANLRGARFVRADLSGVVMRAVEIRRAELDAPWLARGGASAGQRRRCGPLRRGRTRPTLPRARRPAGAADPDGLQAAWAALERTWATTLADGGDAGRHRGRLRRR